MELTTAVQAATVMGVVVATATLAKALFEYSRNSALKRADHFFALRTRLHGGEHFPAIMQMLERDDECLVDLDSRLKTEFLGFYEEIALSINSKLIREDVAFYMFGYYAIRCWKSKNFWINLNRTSPYWALFAGFAEKMLVIENEGRISPKQLKF